MYTISTLKHEIVGVQKVYPACLMYPSVSSGVTVANANFIISSGVEVTNRLLSARPLLLKRLPPMASDLDCREVKTLAWPQFL